MIHTLQKKQIGVLGFGIEGITTVRFLLKHHIIPQVLDKRILTTLEEYRDVFKEFESQGVKFFLGDDYTTFLENYDIIVRTPGISPLHPTLLELQKKGITITSHTQLFLDMCPCPVIGVTGTKGKGTTASLIYEMIKKEGKDVYLGGNIGKPPLDFLDTLNEQSIVVLELSSFQLQDLTKSPHTAVLLMVTQEHLDYHQSIEEYINAKRNILRFQSKNDVAVINRDYPASNESDIYTEGKIYFVSRERESTQGCFIKNENVWLRYQGRDEKIVSTKEILLPGKHNWENVTAAVMAATIVGVSKKNIISVLQSFKGLEHRLELVAEIGGVRYYDDSFATTPETTIAAIEAFTNPEILILGGSTKHADFSYLGETINTTSNIKAIIGIGQEWQRIKPHIHSRVRFIEIIERARSMAEVVQEAADIADPGDIVLLSPGCASFDMFKNYKDRGEQFKKEVRKLEQLRTL